MKSVSLFISSLPLVFLTFCKETSTHTVSPLISKNPNISYTQVAYNNTKGYDESGTIIKHFYCPDTKTEFPPINLKDWEKVPAVYDRLPKYEETIDGTSIHHYGVKENSLIKHYTIKLPKLARYTGPVSVSFQSAVKNELVVVVQAVQTAEDTIVGYRFLSGGVGGSKISHYHFLTEDEVQIATGY